MSRSNEPFEPSKMVLPAPQLFTYYLLGGLLSGPFIVFALPAIWFRYTTLKYKFEETGMRMSVGVLFRKESVTAYRRIQDIHVSSNVIQRWLGISSISIQTASGSSAPEIVIEGVTEPEKLRDWLYARLRGAKEGRSQRVKDVQAALAHDSSRVQVSEDVATQLLTDIRNNLAEMLRQREGQS